MVQMGIISRCFGAYDEGLKKMVFVQEDKLHQKQLNNPKSYFFNPSISNHSIDEALQKYSTDSTDPRKNISDIMEHKFANQMGHEIWYQWKHHCFTTVSLMNLFLVQLYTAEGWNVDLSTGSNIFKEKLENRRHNIVSFIEFDHDLVLLEEENVAEASFYTNRKVRIFVGKNIFSKFKFNEINDLEKLFTKAMRIAESKLSKLTKHEEGDITFKYGVS